MRNKVKKNYQGFVPNFVSHPIKLCAYYHCTEPRLEDRRWCKKHTKQYDQEALQTETKILVHN